MSILIKARRITGGAKISTCKDGHQKQCKVGLRRYNRIKDTLEDVAGLRDSRVWAARHFRHAKHWA